MALEFVCNYMRDAELRRALNRLTREAFGFDFEAWYIEGDFKGGYVPFSYMQVGEVMANASANIMDFSRGGKKYRLIQIGTVTTRAAFRGRGLARDLIRRILARYAGEYSGFYLFANHGAAGFYEKLGFTKGAQYVYAPARAVEYTRGDFERVPARDLLARRRFLYVLRNARANSGFDACNYSLSAFHTMDMDCAYYSRDMDTYAFAWVRDGILYLDEIISTRNVSALEVIESLGLEHESVIVRFTPRRDEIAEFTRVEARDADDILYYIGDGAALVIEQNLAFAPYSRA